MSFDADSETLDIHTRVEVIPAELEVGNTRSTSAREFALALSAPASLLVIMTHGFEDNDQWVSDHGFGEAKQVVRIEEVAPAEFDCDALVLLACHQQAHSWRPRMSSGTVLACSPDPVSTGAIKHLAPALLRRNATTALEIERTIQVVGKRCSTLLTREWSVRSD